MAVPMQVYVANTEAKNGRSLLIQSLGLEPDSSMGHCIQQVCLRLHLQTPGVGCHIEAC